MTIPFITRKFSPSTDGMQKVCIITCYKDPDYIRARTLRAALRGLPGYEVVVVKNSHRGLLRYPEIIGKLLWARRSHRPDVYLLTFRGYELLPFFLLLTLGKKRIFDEFINLVEWVVYEHHKLPAGSMPAWLLWYCYRFLLRKNNVILADTEAHAQYSAELMHLPPALFQAIPVSTDETVFRPQKTTRQPKGFQVFYYGNMLPLHGLKYVLEAAVALRDRSDINFLIAGGKADVQEQVAAAQSQGAHITYHSWIPFEELPNVAGESTLCLGGPFGGTLQANMVITGKTYQFLAMGVPTLVGKTKAAGALEDGNNCLVVPQADAGALAQKIAWAAAHHAELRAIGETGRQTYLHYYANAVVADELQSLLGSLGL